MQREFKMLRLPVAITDTDQVPVPILKATDFIRCIDRFGFWDKLFGADLAQGQKMCVDFWMKYKRLYPHFEFFVRDVPLHQSLPIYIHGDEGQHYKRGAVMICQWQSLFGTGSTLNNPNMFGNLSGKKYFTNQRRVTLATRFLFAVMPKDACPKSKL